MLCANFAAARVTELELPLEVLHCGYRDFPPFSFRDLDLDPMTFISRMYRSTGEPKTTRFLESCLIAQTYIH